MAKGGERYTINSEIEYHILKIYEILTDRPDYFAMSLDRLLKIYPEYTEETLLQFGKVAHKVSTPILIQMYNYFWEKIHTSIWLVDNITQIIVPILNSRFNKLKSVDKIYVDLKEYNNG